MHAKVTVADDVVFLGSFNLSRSGEQNAESVLEIHDPRSPSVWRGSWTRSAGAIRLRRFPRSSRDITSSTPSATSA